MSRLVQMHLVILARRGWTQTEVARAYGVSRQAVSEFSMKHGIEWPGLVLRQQARDPHAGCDPVGGCCAPVADYQHDCPGTTASADKRSS